MPRTHRKSTVTVSKDGRSGRKNFLRLLSSPLQVLTCLFIVSLIQDGVSCSVIDEVHYGLKWIHQIAGYEDPCIAPIVLSVLEAAKRLLSRPVHKKEAVTPETIILLFDKFDHPSASLSDLRVLTLSVLCYAGFLRFSEAVQLR